MILAIIQYILQFIAGGVSAVKGSDMKSLEEKIDKAASGSVNTALSSVISAIENGDIALPDLSRVISPFECHMEPFFTPETVKTNTGVIESLGSSLDSLSEEILSLIPDSKLSNRVSREDDGGIEVISGRLDWKVDNYSPLVYSICMDLLKDGFMYRNDTKSFVITAEVAR